MPRPHSQSFTRILEDVDTLALFSDEATARRYAQVEIALARAQSELGIIPADACESIEKAGKNIVFNLDHIAATTKRDGFPIIGIVAQLRKQVDKNHACYIHWGSTTQDIMDTALVLQLKATALSALPLLEQLILSLSTRAEQNRTTITIGRTHLQTALPISLGLKLANWLSPLSRHRIRLGELWHQSFVPQCGGAVGTLAAFADKGPTLAKNLAQKLGLAASTTPWHSQRDRLVALAHWFEQTSNSFAKIASDVLLLSQNEIGELQEPAEPNAGGSSAMPHKQNAILCEGILARTHSLAAHAHAIATAPAPEHERGTRNVQIENLHFPPLCALFVGALKATKELAEGLVINESNIRANIDKTKGLLSTESLALELGKTLPSEQAHSLVREACQIARNESIHVLDALNRISKTPLPTDLSKDESRSIGASNALIDSILADAKIALSKPIPSINYE